MIQRMIQVTASNVDFEMGINIPVDRDGEEYIDEFLDIILNDEYRNNVDWDFID